MRHTLTVLTTTGLVLSAALAACSLGGGGDDDSSAGGSPSAGGSVVALTGGTATGGTATGGAAIGMPEKCPDIPALSQCGVAAQTADIKVVNMMLVLDKSGSMADPPTPDQDSKWVSLGNALKDALGGVQDQMNLGLIMYPYDPAAGAEQAGVTCSVVDGAASVNVPIGPGTQTVGDIVRIVQGTTPSGGTPTAAALQAAYNYFTTGAGSTMAGDRYVLLATDGGPNCNSSNVSCRDDPDLCTANLDAQAPAATVTCTRPNCCVTAINNMLRSELCLDNGAVVDAITRLKNAGVTTYVVGIPGSEVYSAYLDQFAEASEQISPMGPKKYYEVTADGGVKSLTDTFTGIVTQLVTTCDIPLDPAPDDPNFVNVAIDCELKTQDEPGAGWVVDGSTLKLLGTTCERVKTSGVERVDLYYGCRPVQ